MDQTTRLPFLCWTDEKDLFRPFGVSFTIPEHNDILMGWANNYDIDLWYRAFPRLHSALVRVADTSGLISAAHLRGKERLRQNLHTQVRPEAPFKNRIKNAKKAQSASQK